MPGIRATTLAALAMIVMGCASTTPPHAAVGGGGIIHERNQGYSLLYKLLSDESNVGKIFFLKSADDPVKSAVKEISTFAKTAKKQMDDLAGQDKQLSYDMTDLPYIEQRSRDLEAKDDEHLLLSSSGKEFELYLIFTQAQAMGYAHQLTAALLEKVDNPAQKSFLQNTEKQSADFHHRLIQMLGPK